MQYYMLHKPSGCVSARRDDKAPTVMDLFPEPLRRTLFPLGRLDKYSEGLLLITDDGKLNRRLLDPANHVQKEYCFWAAGQLDEAACRAIAPVCGSRACRSRPVPPGWSWCRRPACRTLPH